MARQKSVGLILVFSWLVTTCLCSNPFQEYGVVTTNSAFRFVGDTLELYCNITNPDVRENSSMLFFDRNTTKDYSIVPADYVEILTTRAIRLRLRDVGISDEGVYTCLQRTISGQPRLIGHKIIKVDYKPRRIENVSCRVYNWEEMKCTWDLGVDYMHPENINVSVAWTIHGQQHDCPKLTKTSCLWDDEVYSHGNQYYMLIEVKTMVDGQILLQERSPQFRIETILYVEPAAVSNLQATVENSTCIRLTWKHDSGPERRKYFVAQYKLATEDENKWKDMILNQDSKGEMYDSFKCGLTPYTEYQFQMSVLPFPEETPEPVNQGHRSRWEMVSAKTLDDVPGAAPGICPGCFEHIDCPQKRSHQCYRIYWQDLDEKDKHGILTSYDVTYRSADNKTGESRSTSVPITTSDAMVYYDLELPNADLNFEVTVTAATSKGLSRNSSQLLIPSLKTEPNPPQRFLVEKDKDADDFRFYLSWAALDTDEKTGLRYSGISVVWCISVPLKSLCKGDIHWEPLKADQVTYELNPEITAGDNILIGITAEVTYQGRVMSSGIYWSKCVYLRNQTPQNSPKKVRESESSQHPPNGLIILWDRYDCTEERTFITEYLVKYCPSYEGKMCSEPEKSHNVSNAAGQVTLTNLRADTRYKVNVMAVSTAGLGPPSQLFSQAVKRAPPEPKAQTNVGIIVGTVIVSAVLLVIIVIICCRYCSSRKKRIPKTEGLIEPYAQTEAFPSKKPQDFRNRPLPKTPDPEDQHFYGSSACMNNHGSDKVKDNRNSESSSEDSVTSQTNLLSTNAQNGQSPSTNQRNHKSNPRPHMQKMLGSSKELKSLLEAKDKQNSHRFSEGDPSNQDGRKMVLGLKPDSERPDYSVVGLVEGSDSSSRPESARAPSDSQNLPRQSASSGIPTPSSGSVGSYMRFAGPGGSASNSSVGREQQQNCDSVDAVDPRDVEFSSMNTLPLRECVHPHSSHTQLSLYPVHATTQNVPGINSLTSSVLGGHGKASDMDPKIPIRHKPKYIRHYRPSLHADSREQRPTAMNSGCVTAPPHIAFNTSAGTANDTSLSNISPDDLPDGYSKMIEESGNKRGSALLSSVLHFPPPPTSPPPSPCPEDTQYNAAYMASLPPFSSPSHHLGSAQRSSGSLSDPESPLSPQTPTINVDGYIPHEAHSYNTPSYGDYTHHPPQHSTTLTDRTAQFGLQSFPSGLPAVSVEYLPHDSNRMSYHGTNTNYVPVSMMSGGASYSTATLPRTASMATNTLPLPSPLSRPLSGDLLELPPQYYQDPNLEGSNQILTEL